MVCVASGLISSLQQVEAFNKLGAQHARLGKRRMVEAVMGKSKPAAASPPAAKRTAAKRSAAPVTGKENALPASSSQPPLQQSLPKRISQKPSKPMDRMNWGTTDAGADFAQVSPSLTAALLACLELSHHVSGGSEDCICLQAATAVPCAVMLLFERPFCAGGCHAAHRQQPCQDCGRKTGLARGPGWQPPAGHDLPADAG